MVCVSVENVSNGMVLQMRVATERSKLVRGITASFKKLSKSSEVGSAPADMMLRWIEEQVALMPAPEHSCKNLWAGQESISCMQDTWGASLCCYPIRACLTALQCVVAESNRAQECGMLLDSACPL